MTISTGQFASFSTSTWAMFQVSIFGNVSKKRTFVPVICITGNDSPAVRWAAHQSGCLAYLTKPFSAKLLMEPLHRAATGSGVALPPVDCRRLAPFDEAEGTTAARRDLTEHRGITAHFQPV